MVPAPRKNLALNSIGETQSYSVSGWWHNINPVYRCWLEETRSEWNTLGWITESSFWNSVRCTGGMSETVAWPVFQLSENTPHPWMVPVPTAPSSQAARIREVHTLLIIIIIGIQCSWQKSLMSSLYSNRVHICFKILKSLWMGGKMIQFLLV